MSIQDGTQPERPPVLPKENERLTFDVRIGNTTIKAGCRATTLIEALERHNRIYHKLIMETPLETINRIVAELYD